MRTSCVNVTFQGLILTVFFVIQSSAITMAAEPTIADLNQKIEALQKRVDELEAEKKNAWNSPRARNFQGASNWDPFEQINQIQQEMDQMFQDSFGQPGARQGMFSGTMDFSEGFDIKETQGGYEYTFDMTGLDKDKVDIQINEHSITLKGEQSRQDDVTGPGRQLSTRSFGNFVKTIPVPDDADVSGVKTEKVKDSLIIRIPKKKGGQWSVPSQ